MARFLCKLGLSVAYVVAFSIAQRLLDISTANMAFGVACTALAVASMNERKK